MNKNQILCFFAALTLLASCKKDDAKTNTAGIEGTYTFSAMHAKTNSTLSDDQGAKTVALADWTSTDNTGTVVFDNGVLNNSNFSYSVSSQTTGYYYQNDILIDSVSIPFDITILSSNSVSSYKLVGADSIYFPEGGIVAFENTTTSSSPSGGHYKINGNQLTLNMNAIKDSTFTLSGVTYQKQESVEASLIFIKQ